MPHYQNDKPLTILLCMYKRPMPHYHNDKPLTRLKRYS